MVPMQTLIINHFELVANLGLLNTWAGIVLPQLIHPVIIIVYKQFFDGCRRISAKRPSWTTLRSWRILDACLSCR